MVLAALRSLLASYWPHLGLLLGLALVTAWKLRLLKKLGLYHWRLWWENYGTAEIGGRLVLVWWPFGCGQPIVMNGHFGLD